ncbi:Phosphoserine aminotransferase [hydrothermal vent metagenome]|uniref:phosphoserine transaminase n=1 Tax=hydrothermal vent metagenome TaxID=652676 RepID=A0A3B1A1I3_9ZZZZ
MPKIYNFSAGPAILPAEVLAIAQNELRDWHGCGMSVMELSHRGTEFMSIAEKAENDLRKLMAIPKNYKVLFLQGGASSQFAMIPVNLLAGKTTADYINTGAWSKKAIKEAKKFCDVNIAASSEDQNFTTIPAQSEWSLNSQAAYVHTVTNETIGGVEYPFLPETGDIPLVADMSSTILSRPVDVSKYGVIYAGAQKNIGPAGLTVVIVRDDLIGHAPANTTSMFNYKELADNDSMLNTPPTFAWYLAGLVFDWLNSNGGLEAISVVNKRKADKLYNMIDDSSFYSSPVTPECRSWMNVPFTLANADLDKIFLSQSSDAGLVSLKGHRSVGGMRASIYNAMPEEGIDALINFMTAFEKKNG